jgi:formiminotetrahydrofolate cyclodeaminase
MIDADEESGSTKNHSSLQTIEKKVDVFLESLKEASFNHKQQATHKITLGQINNKFDRVKKVVFVILSGH